MGYAHGIKWDDEKVAEEVKKVMDVLKINRMPSNAECKLITGNSSLSDRIARTGGFTKWSKKLNLNVKYSETSEGKKFEDVAEAMIANQGYKVKKMTTKYPYDLLINDHIKIDVKVGKAYISRGSRVHTIGINKKYATCDLYFVFAISEREDIEKLLIIPGIDLNLTSLNFGANSKYDKYLNRWDLLEKFENFYEHLA